MGTPPASELDVRRKPSSARPQIPGRSATVDPRAIQLTAVALRDGRGLRSFAAAAALATMLAGCASGGARARADEALAARLLPLAVERYRRAALEHPDDEGLRGELRAAEAAWLDDALSRFAASTRDISDRSAVTPDAPPLRVALEALTIAEAIPWRVVAEEARLARLRHLVSWTGATLRASVERETSVGHALAARAKRDAFEPVVRRPELAGVGNDLDTAIARAGQATCVRAADAVPRGSAPFSLDLVRAYCKSVNAPLPSPPEQTAVLAGLVSGVAVHASVDGLPPAEAAELTRALTRTLEASAWFSPRAPARGALRLEGAIGAAFTMTALNLSRSWVERTPHAATVTRRERVESSYTARGARMVGTRHQRLSSSRYTFPEVTYADRSVRVTLFRETPRVFDYTATKRHGEYRARLLLRLDLGAGVPLEVRHSVEDAKDGFEHDVEFAPAGIKPQHDTIPSASEWRDARRDALSRELDQTLTSSYLRAFCTDTVSTVEEAARCARARSREVAPAVRSQLALLISDDPDRVLALPRTQE